MTRSEAEGGPEGQGEGPVRPAPLLASSGLRRFAISVAGFSVLLLGVVLLVVPVPGTTVVVVPLGLTILAREFTWARRLRDWSTDGVRRTWTAVRGLVVARRLVPVAAQRP
jgi:hypothetical protein